MQIVIPKNQQADVKVLLNLKTEQLSALRDSLISSAPSTSYRALAELISTKVQIPPQTLLRVIRVLGVLNGLRVELAQSPIEIAEAVINAAEEGKIIETEFDISARRILVDALAMLLADDVDAISVTGKAVELLSEYERTYCTGNTRIISDIRPIFPSGPVASITGAVVSHVLKLAYHQESEEREFFVAMESHELRHLRNLLERAIAKEDQLKNLLSAANVRNIDQNGENSHD